MSCACSGSGHTHSANAVAGAQGAHKGAGALQHGADDRPGGIELVPDGLADRWHVWKQHHRKQAGNIHRHTSHCACTLPAEQKTDQSVRQISVNGSKCVT